MMASGFRWTKVVLLAYVVQMVQTRRLQVVEIANCITERFPSIFFVSCFFFSLGEKNRTRANQIIIIRVI